MSNDLVLLNSKTVTVYSTVGNNQQEVRTQATNWASLRTDLDNAGVTYRGMNVVVGETQVSLVSGEAQIPQSDFTLFLLPEKVKSGYVDFDDDDIDDDDDDDIDEDDDNDDDDDIDVAKQDLINDLNGIKNSIDRVISKLSGSNTVASSDPAVRVLQSKAADIMKNMNL